jgi:hypothetical protein
METIHIDRYDDASHNDDQGQPRSGQQAAQPETVPWYARFMPQGMEMPQSVGDATQKVTTFVKERPGAALVAALGVGLLFSGGLRRHKLLKAAFGAFGVPYLQRNLMPGR